MTTTAEPVPKKRGLAVTHSGALDNVPHYMPAGPTGIGKIDGRRLLGPLTESRLRTLRLEAGLTQRRLAELTADIDQEDYEQTGHGGSQHPRRLGEKVFGVSAFTITRYENGVHAPRPRYLRLIARALSQALGRPIKPDDLRVQGAPGLVSFLEQIRATRSAPVANFYGLLGVKDHQRAMDLIAGRADWSAEELGRAAVLFPEARPLTQDVLVEQARRRDPSLAQRDQ